MSILSTNQIHQLFGASNLPYIFSHGDSSSSTFSIQFWIFGSMNYDIIHSAIYHHFEASFAWWQYQLRFWLAAHISLESHSCKFRQLIQIKNKQQIRRFQRSTIKTIPNGLMAKLEIVVFSIFVDKHDEWLIGYKTQNLYVLVDNRDWSVFP